MSKPLFYVPVVLVVSGEDDIVAKENADEIVEGLMRFSPRDLSGYTFTEQFGVFPASPNWSGDSGYRRECSRINRRES